MTPDKYCTECGYGLNADDNFCPNCGAVVQDMESFSEDFEKGTTVSYASSSGERSSTLNAIMILCFVWGIVAILLGAYFVFDASAMADEYVEVMKTTDYEDGTVWDYWLDSGLDENTLEAIALIFGSMFIVSGAFALLSGILNYRREYYTLSLVFTIVSGIAAGVFLITIVVAIVLVLYLSKCKHEFVS